MSVEGERNSRRILHPVNPRPLGLLEQQPVLGTPDRLFQMLGVPPLPLLCRGGDSSEELGEVREVFGGLVVSGGRGGGSRGAWGSREEGVGEVGEGPCDKGVSPGRVHEACKNVRTSAGVERQ